MGVYRVVECREIMLINGTFNKSERKKTIVVPPIRPKKGLLKKSNDGSPPKIKVRILSFIPVMRFRSGYQVTSVSGFR